MKFYRVPQPHIDAIRESEVPSDAIKARMGKEGAFLTTSKSIRHGNLMRERAFEGKN